jgi:hypothetical protein
MLPLVQREAEQVQAAVERPEILGELTVPEGTGREAAALVEAIEYLDWVLCEESDCEAILAGLTIGALSERLDAAIGTPFAKRGLDAFLKMRAAARKCGHPPEEIKAALALYDELLAGNPGRKKRALQEQVAAETGIPARTLRYHLSRRSQ